MNSIGELLGIAPKTSRHALTFASILMSVFMTGTVMAGPITGTLSYSLDVEPINAVAAPTTLGSAAGLDFDPTQPPGSGIRLVSGSQITTATGSFAGMSSLAILDLIINPFPGSPANFVGVWASQTPGISLLFGLSSLSIVTQTDSLLKLSGVGLMADFTGVDTSQSLNDIIADSMTTQYTWEFTATPNAGQPGFTFSVVQNPITATALPEPGLLGLTGIGLMALGVMRRRQRNKV